MLCSTLASQYWMLAGAGAKLGGPGAVLRVSGLAEIYGKVFRVWLDDDTPSLDKTMAALDKRLANGERMLNRAETACQDFCRFACGFLPRGWKRGERAEAPPAAAPTPAVCGTRLIQRLFRVGLVARPRQILGAFAGKSVVHGIAGERCVRVGKLEAAIRRANPRAERARDATEQRPAIRAANRERHCRRRS